MFIFDKSSTKNVKSNNCRIIVKVLNSILHQKSGKNLYGGEDTPYSSAMKFYNCLQNNYLKQHVSEPTRVRGKDEPSLLDLIITEDSQTQVSSSIDIGSPLGLSDHAVLTWKYLLSIEEKTPNTVSEKPRKYNFYKGDYARFRTLCSNTDWGELLNDSMNIDEMVDTFDDIIQKYKDEAIPLMAHKDGKKKQPWLNRASFKNIRKKHHAWKRFQRTKTHTSYLKYVKERDKAARTLRKAKRNFEKKLARESKTNPKAFYKYCNFKSKKRSNLIRLYTDNTKKSLATSELENANILNNYFGSVYTDEKDSPELILHSASQWLFDEETTEEPFTFLGKEANTQLGDIEVTEAEIYDLLKDIDPVKSTTENSIHPRLLKEGASELKTPVFMIFKKLSLIHI